MLCIVCKYVFICIHCAHTYMLLIYIRIFVCLYHTNWECLWNYSRHVNDKNWSLLCVLYTYEKEYNQINNNQRNKTISVDDDDLKEDEKNDWWWFAVGLRGMKKRDWIGITHHLLVLTYCSNFYSLIKWQHCWIWF